MRFGRCAVVLAAAVGLGGVSARAAPPQTPMVYGVWLSPHKSVKVEAKSCGATLCGSIVWANAEAMSDAKDAGVDKLIGLQLLSGYKKKGPGQWQGHVYVPDMKRTFFSRIEQDGPDRIKISGCILGGLLCKSQTWTRA